MKFSQLEERLKNPKVITVLNIVLFIVLLALILFSAREITTTILQPKKTAPTSIQDSRPSASHDLQDYADILKKNPFGIQGGELKPLSSRAATGTSPSELMLIGTIAGKKELSYAIFIDKGGQQNIFKAGEEIPGLGKLTGVEKDKAYIRSNGRDVEIPFSGITEVREVKPSGTTPSSAIVRKTKDTAYMIDQQKVAQALEKPEQIMTDARFVPHMIEGRQQGFMLRELKPQGIYASLGLQNGDILIRINEFTISSAENALQALTALRGIDRAQLDIIRNGAPLTMTYQIR